MNSKNKGNTFERKIAKVFSDRLKHITGMDNAFRRNPDSGSFFGASNSARMDSYDMSKATLGDIICPEKFRFTIECKHYKAPPSLASFVKQDWKDADKWIIQAKQDAHNSERNFMIVVKYNLLPEMVLISRDLCPGAFMFYKDCAVVPLVAILSEPDAFFME